MTTRRKKASRRRARDSKGHFIRENPRKKRKKARRTVRRASPKRASRRKAGLKAARTRARKKARRSAAARKAARSRKRSHSPKRRSIKRRRRRTHAREETVMANPRRRRRRRSRARETVVMENPKKPRKKKRKAAKRSKARRSHRSRSAAARKGARTRRAHRRGTAYVPAVLKTRRKKGRKTTTRRSPGAVKIQIIAGRAASPRRAAKRRSSGGKRRKGRRKSSKRRYGRHGVFGSARRGGFWGQTVALRENPVSEYGMENPMGAGEMVLAVVTGTLGYALADTVDRILATHAKDATGLTGAEANLGNSELIRSAPGLMRIGAQALTAALPFLGAYFVDQPMGRAALQGAGLGAAVHLFGQLFTHYVAAKMLPSTNDWGHRLYEAEQVADANYANASRPPGTTAGWPGLGGLPIAPLPPRRYTDVGPFAGVGMGPAMMPPVGVPGTGPGTFPRGGRPDGYPQTNGGGVPNTTPGGTACLPCSAETATAGLTSAYAAAKEAVGGCSPEGSLGETPQQPGAIVAGVGAPSNGAPAARTFMNAFPQE